MPEGKNAVSAGAGAVAVVVAGGGGTAAAVAAVAFAEACCCRCCCCRRRCQRYCHWRRLRNCLCVAANYSCCACCCRCWRCCCRPFSSRVLLLLFSWSCLDIHRSPKPALPEASIAPEFELDPSAPYKRLHVAQTATAALRLRRPQQRPCVCAESAGSLAIVRGRAIIRRAGFSCRCGCRPYNECENGAPVLLLPPLPLQLPLPPAAGLLCVPSPLPLSLPLLLAHCSEKGGSNLPLEGSSRSISFVGTFL